MSNRALTGDALSGHIDNFAHWKKDLTRSIKSFRLWLGRNNLYSEKVDQRLSDLLKILKDDYVTIAFAGEFSRGKSELINALFFAGYGQRILPSQAGRTTMCPTELFYDQHNNSTYLKLLPIETRTDTRPLNAFRHLPDYWLDVPLDTQSAEAMANCLQKVTETQLVSPELAEELGFCAAKLERHQQNKLVEIPKWRHALVSFDHPLLKKGLCILDTPGLNALGSEPELTLSLLPKAQAVIFLLTADAGVTASDMAIWEEHVSQLKNRSNLGLYAVLNKVDMLWDELSTATEIKKNLDKVIKTTARQLGLPIKDVIPVSAQKGLLAKVKKDPQLLTKSHLGQLEEILSKTVMVSKEKSLWEGVLADTNIIVKDSMKTLKNRRLSLLKQRDDIALLKNNDAEQTEKLIENCRISKQQFQQQQLSIKPSIRLMERQTIILKETISPKKLQLSTDAAAKAIISAKSTLGMLRGMRDFFFSVDAIMINFCHEAELSNKMAESIFSRFQQEHDLEPFAPRVLTAKRFHRELKSIIRDSDQFNRHLKLALTGQHQVVNRFFNTTVHNINSFFDQLQIKLDNWTNNILHPLTHQVEDHKNTLQAHLDDLKLIHKNKATATGRMRALNTIIDDLDHEFEQCNETLHLLNKFNCYQQETNVLQFHKREYDSRIAK